MRALVVYESMWGNTEAVARAVAEGLQRGYGADEVAVRDVVHEELPDPTVELLVVGGPTHAFSMSRSRTREDAVRRGAPAGHESRGIREWLADLPHRDDLAVATFDTKVEKVRRLPGSAARKAASEVRRHQAGRLLDSETFYVEDMAGPLCGGELDRARAWGAELAAARVG